MNVRKNPASTPGTVEKPLNLKTKWDSTGKHGLHLFQAAKKGEVVTYFDASASDNRRCLAVLLEDLHLGAFVGCQSVNWGGVEWCLERVRPIAGRYVTSDGIRERVVTALSSQK